jgi:hypothetical protein
MRRLPVSIKWIFSIFISCLLLASITLSSGSVKSATQNTSTPANTQLQDDLKKIQDELKKVKEQKDAINSQINRESTNQTKLKNDAQYIDTLINQNELQVQDLQLQISELELQIKIATEEKTQTENRVTEIEKILNQLTGEESQYMNLLYKMSLHSHSFLEANASFESEITEDEETNTIIKIVKGNISEVKQLRAEANVKKDEISQKQKQLTDLQNQNLAKNEALKLQQNGLAWQKENKLTLVEQSKKNQVTLTEQKTTIDQKIIEYEQKIAALMASLYNTVPSGTRVDAGQVIGRQGRSGLSCNPIQPGMQRTNDYCQRYAGLSSEWYYYDPVQYPTNGSHLHFMYWKNGAQVVAANYLSGNEFKRKPLDNYVITQYNHEGGAVDMVNFHGAPIYAVKPGTIKYYCINWPPVPNFPDPAFGAIIYHDDGSRSQYWHLQRNAIPCTYL